VEEGGVVGCPRTRVHEGAVSVGSRGRILHRRCFVCAGKTTGVDKGQMNPSPGKWNGLQYEHGGEGWRKHDLAFARRMLVWRNCRICAPYSIGEEAVGVGDAGA
jgi:hypothetical protein